MSRRSRTLLVAAIALAIAVALAAGASGAVDRAGSASRAHAPASGCALQAPRSLRLRRLSTTRARLSWRAPRGVAHGARLTYRVLRAHTTIGQTRASSIVVRITLGRIATYTVQVLRAQRPGACSARLRAAVAFRPPGQVRALHLIGASGSSVTVGWQAAARGDAALAGYRVQHDGSVAGQTQGLSFTLHLSVGHQHRVNVIAVDRHGELGPSSATLLIGAQTSQAAAVPQPPGVPGSLSAAEVGESSATIVWLASQPGSAAIAGYRVYRDNELVGQSSTDSLRLTHLAFPHSYQITVAAIDATGRESPRTAPLELSTTHAAPTAPALLSAVRVSDTSATLSWQEGSASEGASVVGYLLFKDGQPVGVVHGQIVTESLASEREYTFTVRTLDSDGYLSEPAPALRVLTTHTPPPAPEDLSVSEVTSQSALLSWSPSTAISGTIVGYRVFRDEIPVGQTATPQLALSNLAPSSEYTITVSAVDSLGAVSAPSVPLRLITAEPTPTHGSVQAFLLDSVSQSFDDLEAHYQQIGVIYPTYFNCGAAGEVLGKDDPLVTKWALARKIEVLPRLNCQNVADEEHLLNDLPVRETLIENLVALCETYGYGGVQIDFEGAPPSERNPFTAFITTLAERLHAHSRKLSTIVTAKYYNVMSGRAAMYDDAALSVPSDYMVVLDWGLHWTTSAPGSIDEMAWFKRIAEYTATLPNRSKFVLAMPMYGVDWAEGGGPSHPGVSMEYSEIMALADELGVSPEWEANAQSPHFSYTDSSGAHHEVWFTDQQSIGARAQLAQSLGLGVGLWRLGNEDQSVWELPVLGGAG